jgi:dUTP pyrophosphatase
MKKLEVKILDERVRGMLPHYATPGAAGLDLRACLDAPLALQPGDSQLVSSGIAIHVGTPGYPAALRPGREERHRPRKSGGPYRFGLPGTVDGVVVESR